RPHGAELSTAQPLLKAALWALAEERPRGLTFEVLCGKARRLLDGALPSADDRAVLGDNLLGLFTRGYLDLEAWAPPYVTRPGPRPATSALARLQAERGRFACTSLRHQSVRTDKL